MNLTISQLLQCAEQFGTPLYVYNADNISYQYNILQHAFASHPTRFFYACKALTNIYLEICLSIRCFIGLC